MEAPTADGQFPILNLIWGTHINMRAEASDIRVPQLDLYGAHININMRSKGQGTPFV